MPFRFGVSTLKLCPQSDYAEEACLAKAVLRVGLLGSLLALAVCAVAESVSPQPGMNIWYQDKSRADTLHYCLPGKPLPLEECDTIERFDGQRWVDCRDQALAASRILRTGQIYKN